MAVHRIEQRIQVADGIDHLDFVVEIEDASDAPPDEEIVLGEHHADRHDAQDSAAGGHPHSSLVAASLGRATAGSGQYARDLL
jgi:hypothetical protein